MSNYFTFLVTPCLVNKPYGGRQCIMLRGMYSYTIPGTQLVSTRTSPMIHFSLTPRGVRCLALAFILVISLSCLLCLCLLCYLLGGVGR